MAGSTPKTRAAMVAIQGSMSALTIPCGIVDTDRGSYRRLAPHYRPACHRALQITASELRERTGNPIRRDVGRDHQSHDAITNHIGVKDRSRSNAPPTLPCPR